MMFALGRFTRRAWNGPFYIGKITRPASVGDVLMKLLETAWRAFFLFFAGGAILLAGIAVWFEVLEPALNPPLEKKIDISAKWDDGKSPDPVGSKPFRCTPDFPVMLTIVNKSRETIGEIGFSIAAREENSSTDLAQSSERRLSDAIIKPGYTARQCWNVPLKIWISPDRTNPAKLIYTPRLLDAAPFDPTA